MSNALALAAIAGVLILAWVLILYRRGRIKEDHALLWVAVSTAIILLSTWTALLVAINQIVGAARVSDVVLASFVTFLIVISVYYSVKISELSEQNRRIAQQLAVMSALNPEKADREED